MNHQSLVKETYLRVIESTIEGTRTELQDSGDLTEALSATLNTLRERWQARLLEFHDFSDDPTASVRGNAARGSSAANRRGATADAGAHRRSAPVNAPKPTAADRARALGAPAAADAGHLVALGAVQHGHPGGHPGAVAHRRLPHMPVGTAPNPMQQGTLMRNEFVQQHAVVAGARGGPMVPGIVPHPGVPGMAPLSGGIVPINPLAPQPLEHYPQQQPALDPAVYRGAPLPPSIGETGQGQGRAPGSSNVPQGDGPGSSGESPPAKRARREAEEDVNNNENLDSSDDDDENGSQGGSDAPTENYILAQHDSVKKGSGNGKWKVRLKGGIVHLNGRDYLFNRASCDLDW